jgi:group II intron reverse transcriptase/maturase
MIEKTQGKKIEISEACLEGSERNLRGTGTGAFVKITAKRVTPKPEMVRLMEQVVDASNMSRALKRVEQNGGAGGVDEMTTGELREYLKAQWPRIKAELLKGTYQPQAVREVEIPKPDGGVRKLGIPTVLDRLIQQAMHQVLNEIFDKGFSESSCGFRPKRNAHQAVVKAREYVRSGRRWVVDMDLEKFFDRVNHDVLMSRVARKVKDRSAIALLYRYLQSGILKDGLVEARHEGTPQGGPLSPLLSNILLDDLDKELERRGHVFCRYADDCNIYVATKHAGERVMTSIEKFLETKLRLKVNRSKSAVDRVERRKFLGYTMTFDRNPRLKMAAESVRRIKDKLRECFRRGRGRNLARLILEDLNPLLTGWVNYFRRAEVKGIFEELDSWIRRKLRCVLWRQMKRSWTRAKRFLSLGFEEQHAIQSAMNQRGAWWNSGASHMNKAFKKAYFDRMRLVSLFDKTRNLQFEFTL